MRDRDRPRHDLSYALFIGPWSFQFLQGVVPVGLKTGKVGPSW